MNHKPNVYKMIMTIGWTKTKLLALALGSSSSVNARFFMYVLQSRLKRGKGRLGHFEPTAMSPRS